MKHDLLLRGGKLHTVRAQEGVGGHEAGTLIAVEERMIPHNARSIRSSEIEQIRVTVCKRMLRTPQGGIQEPFISHTGQPPVSRQQFLVGGKNDFASNPDGLVHLANSRSAFR